MKHLILFLIAGLLTVGMEATAQTETTNLLVTMKDGSVTQFDINDIDSLSFRTTEVAEAPKPGDYYYGDGTWSTALNVSKTCIGVVFYVGDVASDDAKLQTKLGPTNKGNHGLVVALRDASPTVWMAPSGNVEVSTSLNVMNGYTNTLTMRSWQANHADTPIALLNALDEYASANQAPSTSSGWYVPSLKELSTLCSGYTTDVLTNDYGDHGISMRQQVETCLKSLGDKAADFVSSGTTRFYWSSTVLTEAHHMAVGFEKGTIRDVPSNDTNNPRSLRVVLAF